MDDLITSPANPRLKLIRRLRERKVREQHGLFYVEGIRLVAEAIQQDWPIEMLVVAPHRLSSAFAWQHVEQRAARGSGFSRSAHRHLRASHLRKIHKESRWWRVSAGRRSQWSTPTPVKYG